MTENEKRLNLLRDSLEGCSAASIRRFVTTALGPVPIVGGLIGSVSGAIDDFGQKKKDEAILSLLKDHEDRLNCIWNAIFGNEPSKEKLAYLFNEILGIDIPQSYIVGNQFAYLMSSFSREEFRVFEKLGWLSIKSTGSYVSNFTNHIMGFEYEKKRIDGDGFGYIISVSKLYYK
ncbi:hypothetical protein IKQ19_04630 [Candidatus Saccharibacteria bacterium]|nr:hypothetical protein [Candidatus Saccharibacteria bacterium]